MSDLERVAQETLSSMILAQPSHVQANQGALTRWIQKAAMVAMLISSEKERISGYGIAKSEYAALPSV